MGFEWVLELWIEIVKEYFQSKSLISDRNQRHASLSYSGGEKVRWKAWDNSMVPAK